MILTQTIFTTKFTSLGICLFWIFSDFNLFIEKNFTFGGAHSLLKYLEFGNILEKNSPNLEVGLNVVQNIFYKRKRFILGASICNINWEQKNKFLFFKAVKKSRLIRTKSMNMDIHTLNKSDDWPESPGRNLHS